MADSTRSKPPPLPGSGRSRWIAGLLAAIAAGLALWALSTCFGAPPAPMDDIGPASREQLDRVLRDADREEVAP
jgi:hypothetical protein